MPVYPLKTAIIHGNKIVLLTRRVKTKTQDEMEAEEQALQLVKSNQAVNKSGNRKGMSQGSRSGAGNIASGEFTPAVRRSLQRCTDIFFQRTPLGKAVDSETGKSTFLKAAMHTLTIPGGADRLTAAEFRKLLLNPYVQTLERVYGVQAWVGGFEKHTEEGNLDQIHCHLFVDKFIPKKLCKKRWVALLRKNSLTEIYDSKYDKDPSQACHIKGIRSSNILQWYLQKYLTKSKQKAGVTHGHWWGASAWIKKCPLPTFEPSEKTMLKIYANRSSPAYYFTDIYIEPDSKKMLFNEEGAFTPGAKRMMTVVRGNYFKEKKIRADVKDLLAADDRKVYDAFTTAYRRCDWQWCQMAAQDLEQLKRVIAEMPANASIYEIVRKQAQERRKSNETDWMRYMREVKEKPPLKKRPKDKGPELDFDK